MSDDAPAAAREIERTRDQLSAVRAAIETHVVGQNEVVDQLLIALLAGGHVLLEGPPGLGKTLLVRTLASAVDLTFRRVQCTPDLMPSDITGTVVLTQGEGAPHFAFREGPVFTHVLLADEINRASPKTQSALLEAMAEHAVTVAGETRPLPDPFLVLATQNPIEMEGTYPLPEAQLDRFLLKIVVAAPNVEDLVEIVRRTTATSPEAVTAVLDREHLLAAREVTRRIALAPALATGLARAVHGTHPTADAAPDDVRRFVRHGVSPRGATALALAAKARALLAGRPHVAGEDLSAVALPVMRHRVVLGFEAEAEGRSADDVLRSVLPLLT